MLQIYSLGHLKLEDAEDFSLLQVSMLPFSPFSFTKMSEYNLVTLKHHNCLKVTTVKCLLIVSAQKLHDRFPREGGGVNLVWSVKTQGFISKYLNVGILVTPTGPKPLQAVDTRVDSQWRREEAFGKRGGDATQPAASHKGKIKTPTGSHASFCFLTKETLLFFVCTSMRKGSWRRFGGRFAISSLPRRAGRRRRSTLTGWRAGEHQI